MLHGYTITLFHHIGKILQGSDTSHRLCPVKVGGGGSKQRHERERDDVVRFSHTLIHVQIVVRTDLLATKKGPTEHHLDAGSLAVPLLVAVFSAVG